jgi:hypothetical protein
VLACRSPVPAVAVLAAAAEAVLRPGPLAIVVPELLKDGGQLRGVLSGYCMRDRPFARLAPTYPWLQAPAGLGESPRSRCRPIPGRMETSSNIILKYFKMDGLTKTPTKGSTVALSLKIF